MTITYKKSIFTFSVLLLIVLLSFAVFKYLKKEPLSRTEFTLGTTVTITLYDHQSEDLLNQSFEKLNKIEKQLSINEENTLITTINANAGLKEVFVDTSTFELIQKGLNYSSLTNGAFDIAIGPLVKLWHIGFPDAHIPSSHELSAVLPLLDYKMVKLDPTNKTVYLAKKDMALDLGGIAKGYAADVIATFLKENNVRSAIINLGGNIYVLGKKNNHKPWIVGIQDPFLARGEILGTLTTYDCSIVTSGIYERYIEDDKGHTYHHILNPLTGFPYENELAGVTIVSPSSTDGDALSTAAFALGLHDGLSFIEKQPHIEGIFVTKEHKVYITSGLTKCFKLTNSQFTLAH